MRGILLSQCFPRKERLGKREFKKVLSDGRRCADGLLVVRFLKHGTRRVGFVIRKQVRPAVKRNCLKRSLREIYRRNKDRIIDGFAIVVVVGEKAQGLSSKELEESFLQVLGRAGLIRKR